MCRMLGSNRYRVIDLGRGKSPFRNFQATPWGMAFLQPPHVNALNQANEDGRTNEVRATI
jgi:Lon protease-like protein